MSAQDPIRRLNRNPAQVASQGLSLLWEANRQTCIEKMSKCQACKERLDGWMHVLEILKRLLLDKQPNEDCNRAQQMLLRTMYVCRAGTP